MPQSRQRPLSLTRHAYWLVTALPLLVPLGWWMKGSLPANGVLPFNDVFAWFTPLALYAVLPVVDWLLGRDTTNPDQQAKSSYTDILIPMCASASYFSVLIWALITLTNYPDAFSGFALLGWVLSLANIGGIIAINVSHELIHRRSVWLQSLGGAMLASVGYASFKLTHPRWHHVKVATPEDPSSAPKGSTVYGQVPRAMWLNTQKAFSLAIQSRRQKGFPLPGLFNEMTLWTTLTAVMALTFGLWLGPMAAVVFVLHGLGAAALLEVINYVEHYGLSRKRREDGRYEPPQLWHSWDTNFWLSNILLIQLPRHADHHVHPSRPFAALQQTGEAPQLPVGYATAVLMAMAPFIWRRVMDVRLPQ